MLFSFVAVFRFFIPQGHQNFIAAHLALILAGSRAGQPCLDPFKAIFLDRIPGPFAARFGRRCFTEEAILGVLCEHGTGCYCQRCVQRLGPEGGEAGTMHGTAMVWDGGEGGAMHGTCIARLAAPALVPATPHRGGTAQANRRRTGHSWLDLKMRTAGHTADLGPSSSPTIQHRPRDSMWAQESSRQAVTAMAMCVEADPKGAPQKSQLLSTGGRRRTSQRHSQSLEAHTSVLAGGGSAGKAAPM